MSFPAQSVLMGPNSGDAWFTAGLGNSPVYPQAGSSSNRALIETNGGSLIHLVQGALNNGIQQYRSVLPADVIVPSSGEWDATTARAALLLADKTGALKNAYSADYIDSAWGEYYKHRFDMRLTTIVLAILVNDALVAGQIEDAIGLPRTTRGGAPVPAYEPGEIGVHNFNVEISHDAILPRWGTTPRGEYAYPTIRRICNGSLDNCA